MKLQTVNASVMALIVHHHHSMLLYHDPVKNPLNGWVHRTGKDTPISIHLFSALMHSELLQEIRKLGSVPQKDLKLIHVSVVGLLYYTWLWLLNKEKAGDGNRQFSHEFSACLARIEHCESRCIKCSSTCNYRRDRNSSNSHRAELDLFWRLRYHCGESANRLVPQSPHGCVSLLLDTLF